MLRAANTAECSHKSQRSPAIDSINMNGFRMQELTATATAIAKRPIYDMALDMWPLYLAWKMNCVITRGSITFTSSSDLNLKICLPLPSPEWMDIMLTLAGGDIDAHIHIKYYGKVTVFVPVRTVPRPSLVRCTAGKFDPGLDPVYHKSVFTPFTQC